MNVLFAGSLRIKVSLFKRNLKFYKLRGTKVAHCTWLIYTQYGQKPILKICLNFININQLIDCIKAPLHFIIKQTLEFERIA